jgi:hypothetical protein
VLLKKKFVCGMQIFFVFLCQQTCKNKIISEKIELRGDRNEIEHAI